MGHNSFALKELKLTNVFCVFTLARTLHSHL